MNSFMRYVAINTKQPERMADHYQQHFGLREVARSSDGDISLTDGWMKLSLLAHWPDNEITGISRYGIAIADLDELKAKLSRKGGPEDLQPDLGGDHRGEYILRDPYGMPWSISARNFGLGDRPENAGVLRIRHAEISVANTDRHMAWMIDTLGFEEIHTSVKFRKSGNPFPLRQLGDGQMNVTFLPFDRVPGKRMSAEQRENKWAIQHFGWVLPDMYEFVSGVPMALRSLYTKEGNMAEYRVFDPDGNAMDLSEENGFEVAFDLWERGTGPGGPPQVIRV
jgi:catechol 2,3-dioxygenase-like lactoylglutathione lyase family enzyme